MSSRLDLWNAMEAQEAAAQAIDLCGSRAWARCLAQARPLASPEDFRRAAEDCWKTLAERDWIEAFAAHPRIGDRRAAGMAAREQSAVADARAATLEDLDCANRDYEERFGRVFLVCASGKSAAEMLAVCRRRLHNDPRTELAVSAQEQKMITRLRLEKWLA